MNSRTIIPVLIGLVVVAQITTSEARQGTAQGAAQASIPAAARLLLHGSTPSMAWSPDSTRVAINAAYNYYGYEEQITAHRESLGVYVLDARSGSAVQVSPQQGYHPLWLDAGTVAWGHSPYEDGDAGLFKSPADRTAPARIGSDEGVYHTLLARSGGILYYSGFPGYRGWVIADSITGALTELGKEPEGGTEGSSWNPPADQMVDQCLQQAGTARIVALSNSAPTNVGGRGARNLRGTGLSVEVGGRSLMIAAKGLFETSAWMPAYGQGVTRACLSPDGAHVAWLSGAPDGYALSTAPLPQ